MQQMTRRRISFLLPFLAALGGCSGDDETAPAAPGPDGGSSNNPPAAAADAITEAVLAACPQATTLIETTEWTTCLVGKRVSGTEPFNNTPCELRFGAGGAIEYVRSGTTVFSVPARSGYGPSASGTYQNERVSASRLFLASVAPALTPQEGMPRFERVTINLFELASQEDTVAIDYMDAALSRQTYNCKVNAL